MLRKRILILLSGCVLAASAAKADDLGYIDCRNHPDETQVFAKARQTHETVGSLPCGERFTILLYGFIFSRIQTRDGKIGYVYSSVISADRSSGTLAPSAAKAPAANPQPAAASASVAQPKPVVTEPQASAPAQVAAAPAASPAAAQPSAAAASSASATPATATPAPAAAVAPAAAPDTNVTPTASDASANAQPSAAPAPAAAPEATLPPANVPVTPQTDAAPAAQPEASAAEAAPPAAPAVKAANARESWEKPNAGMRTVGLRRLPLIELFGGYAFTRFDNGAGSYTNFNGVLGSFGWNVRPWLQIVADSSYSVVTVSGVKNVLYGNHYGPRIFRRVRNRWGITPFVEGLVGGSRADATVSGAGGYTSSVNCISYKAGGGVDVHPSKHIEIRLFDVDYYRTAFGTNLHQNNYWASTGIVIRLFGGSE
jgi:hypothetical protein